MVRVFFRVFLRAARPPQDRSIPDCTPRRSSRPFEQPSPHHSAAFFLVSRFQKGFLLAARLAQDRFIPDCTLRRSSRPIEQPSLHHNATTPPNIPKNEAGSLHFYRLSRCGFCPFLPVFPVCIVASSCEFLRVRCEQSSSTLVKNALFSIELV